MIRRHPLYVCTVRIACRHSPCEYAAVSRYRNNRLEVVDRRMRLVFVSGLGSEARDTTELDIESCGRREKQRAGKATHTVAAIHGLRTATLSPHAVPAAKGTCLPVLSLWGRAGWHSSTQPTDSLLFISLSACHGPFQLRLE